MGVAFRTSSAVLLCSAACSAADGNGSAEPFALSLVQVDTFTGTTTSGDSPVLEMPAYLRVGPDGRLWTLDTSRKSVVGLDFDGEDPLFVGNEGHGPGELWITVGFDVAPDGTVWIADPGNAKVAAFRDGDVVGEFQVDHQPLGVVAARDGTVWVVGDLIRSVFVRYDESGRRLGTIGSPLEPTPERFRFNQGVAAPGSAECAAIWAYTFHSVVTCYGVDGELRWQAEGPGGIHPPKDADPFGMSPGDRFAYVDVTVHEGTVYALFVGRTPDERGLGTRELHLFDERDGTFRGAADLPRPTNHLLRYDSLLATLGDEPEPTVRIYRVHDAGSEGQAE